MTSETGGNFRCLLYEIGATVPASQQGFWDGVSLRGLAPNARRPRDAPQRLERLADSAPRKEVGSANYELI